MTLALVLASHDACQWHQKSTTAFLMSRQSKWYATSVFGHLLPLPLASVPCHGNSILNGTIAFLWPRWVKCSTIWLLVMQCHWHWHQHYMILMAPLLSLSSGDQNEVQHDFLGHVIPLASALASHDADCIVNATITFLMSRQSKWGATWLFGYMMPLVPVSVSREVNGIIAFLRSKWWKMRYSITFVMWCHWHQHHMIPMAYNADPSTCTSADTKGHIIPLNNHLNIQ